MDSAKTDDEHIIRMVLGGDVDRFRIIIDRYQKRVFNIGMMFYRNVDDASDFVQDVFIKIFDSLSTFKGLSAFYHWLVRVAYNTAINSSRSARQPASLIEELIADGGESPENAHIRGEIREALSLALKELPGKYRTCIELYFFYGISFSEINEITGLPVNTIKSNVFRAKQILRNALQGSIAEDYHEV